MQTQKTTGLTSGRLSQRRRIRWHARRGYRERRCKAGPALRRAVRPSRDRRGCHIRKILDDGVAPGDGRQAYNLGDQIGLGLRIAVQDVPFAALFIVQHKTDSDARSAWPLGERTVAAITLNRASCLRQRGLFMFANPKVIGPTPFGEALARRRSFSRTIQFREGLRHYGVWRKPEARARAGGMEP